MESTNDAPTRCGMARFRVDGCIAAITGGAHGIGLATARLLSEAGARVLILDRDPDAAQAAAAGLPNAASHSLDVSDAQAVDRVFETMRREEGGLDILVNNAGISIRKSSDELTLDEWNQVLTINLTGFIFMRPGGCPLYARQGRQYR